MIRLKTIFLGLICTFVSWTSYKGYIYFFDYTAPAITVQGMHDSAWCTGDVHCSIATNKPCSLSIWVDDVQLIKNEHNGTHKQPYACAIPTDALANGQHQLKVVCTDTSYNQNVSTKECPFWVDNLPLQAVFVDEERLKVLQGRTLHVQFQANKEIEQARVHALAASYDCFVASKEQNMYECYIPIPCEEKPNEYLFSVEIKDRVGNKIALDNKFEIRASEFKKQTIQVNAEKIKEEKERGRSELELEEQLAQLAKSSPSEKLWRGPFCTPIEVKQVTCDFGTIRTSQERGRYMHKALDVINLPKSVVWATQDGVVALKERYDVSGNTVVIDHGHGILSLFYHLDDFADLEVGQKIAQGKPVGTLGKTGYATGYHLHWEMRVRNNPVDPMQWTQETF